ncbi:hypothetical protein E2C01_015491 [Portunus trituberculatus]|uniref:Uncharacterized protein n=1 Tax=Portunus trituberculatus TaxID=210409 RepID=A0A5B7DNC2_PORTR|nr:hypothetical protein [Portunus trituberculatus]
MRECSPVSGQDGALWCLPPASPDLHPPEPCPAQRRPVSQASARSSDTHLYPLVSSTVLFYSPLTTTEERIHSVSKISIKAALQPSESR